MSAQEGHEAALKAWAQWCEHNTGSHCELALSGHWLITCAGEPEQALAQWDHYLGLSAAALDQAWVLRSVPAKALHLSCAAPRALVDGLQKTAREHSVKLRWVGPWWARDAQRWLAALAKASDSSVDDQTLQAMEPGLCIYLTAGHDEQGQLCLRQVWSEVSEASGPTDAKVSTIEISAETLLANWPNPGSKTWQPGWADALDFVGPRVRTALWSWVLLIIGVAASMAVAERAQQGVVAQAEAQATLHRLERARHQLTMARAAPRSASAPSQPTSQKLDEASTRQAVQVAQWLAYPWSEVIAKVEQSAQQEQAVLTGFSLDIGSLGAKLDAPPPVRLQAALRDDASALRWVAAHGEGAQMLGRSALSAPFETMTGHYALRAEAVWPAGAAP
ncbi:hypothetical protein [Aquabacterium sp. CECT 9606]|uniref:hypothetical protein n=1 Tax=Aquabacterium sp. CECT 9606 TaxID=2845822 RepID=UPI001E30EF43|nr:hypothetical protein [Aquabacterium sp. CECT 9606]CAH0351538.1 hypothetical protein AQB9606_02200 [Aquabacterium sp. CECT 9606]